MKLKTNQIKTKKCQTPSFQVSDTIWFLVLFLLSSPVFAMGKKPEAPVPVPTNVASLPKRYLTLEDAYELALRRSETIAISHEEIAKAKADWLRATGDFIGDADFIMTNRQQDALLGSGEAGVGGTLNSVERRERRIVVTQPLFQGFRSWGALTGAGNLSRQRRNEYLRSKELLFLDVSAAFYRLILQKKDVETIEGISSLLQERLQELSEREEIGRSRPSEGANARSRVKIIEARLAVSRGALAIAESLMEFYTGVPSNEAVYEDQEVPKKDIEWDQTYALLADERADVRAASEAMKVAKKAIIVAQSELWPEINLDATHYEMREGFQSGIDWDVLFTVSVPLYKGGETLAEIKEAYSNWKQAKWHHARTKREAERDIRDAHQNWLASLAESEAYRQAVKASEQNYRLQKEDYERSLVNNLEVLAALEELFNTSRDANITFYQMKENYWRLQTAVGNCCPDAAPDVSAAGEAL